MSKHVKQITIPERSKLVRAHSNSICEIQLPVLTLVCFLMSLLNSSPHLTHWNLELESCRHSWCCSHSVIQLNVSLHRSHGHSNTPATVSTPGIRGKNCFLGRLFGTVGEGLAGPLAFHNTVKWNPCWTVIFNLEDKLATFCGLAKKTGQKIKMNNRNSEVKLVTG